MANEEKEENASYETAIAACRYGKFNMLLMVVAIPGLAITVFETTTMSYVMPVAECELKLSHTEKGIINGLPYAGMLVSGVFWGYISDTAGRKRVLISAGTLDFVMVLLSSFSQSTIQLIICKFLGGIMVSGSFAITVTYLAEYHQGRHRPSVMMFVGVIINICLMTLPTLAWLILPIEWHFEVSGFHFNSWQIFLAITSIPSITCATFILLFPETPKFLMSQGKNDAAMEVFKRVYSLNTGKRKDTYPIGSLLVENAEKSAKVTARLGARPSKYSLAKAKVSFVSGLKQIKPLFGPQYLKSSLKVYSLFLCVMTAQNVIRLWLPQIFATFSELEHNSTSPVTMCQIIEYNLNHTRQYKHENETDVGCDENTVSKSYVNNIIIGMVGLCGLIVTSAVLKLVGNSRVLKISLLICAPTSFSFYFASSPMVALVLASIFMTCCSVSISAVLTVAVNVFPTDVRSTVVIIVVSCGRLGTFIGNVLFPYIMALDCIAPFAFVSGIQVVAFVLTLFLPNENVPLT